MKKLVYEERRDGLDLRLEVTNSSLIAKAMRGGKVLGMVSQGHSGVFGPDTFAPQSSALAKAMLQQASDRAVGRLRRNEFDALVDDLHSVKMRARRGIKPAREAKRPAARSQACGIPLLFTSRS